MQHERLIALYDAYVHSAEPRRVFLQKLVRTAGSAAAAAAVLPWLEGSGAEAAMVAPDDGRLVTEEAEYGGAGLMKAYVARPKDAAKLPAVIVIHENRGLTDHIRDVARRLALEGFMTLAPDLISPRGGTPDDQDKARDVLYKIEPRTIQTNLLASGIYAGRHKNSTGKVGAVGFCWGGQRVNEFAVAWPELDAGVAYYGRQPKEGIEKIKAPLLLHYAENDKGVNAGIDAYVAALKAAGKTFEHHQYPGTGHAFNNDTRPARYNKEQAEIAWKRTVAFLKQHLAGSA